MYERIPDVSFSPDECHRLVKAGASLVHAAGAAGPTFYHTTGPGETMTLYHPLLKDRFPDPWQYAMLVILMPGGSLSVHTDGVPEIYRRHVVLQTNPNVWVFHDGVWQQLERGGVYRMDPMKPHGAINWGPEPRIHLLFDIAAPTDQEGNQSAASLP